MKIFSGKLNITGVTEISENLWNISSLFLDNYGYYFATDAKIDDIVYNLAMNNTTMETCVCAYKITAIDSANTDASKLKCTIQYNESYTSSEDIFTPQVGTDCMIGRLSSINGFTALATETNNIPSAMINFVRNLDLRNRDEKYTIYVNQLIDNINTSGNHDATKYDIAGGNITGDEIVEGNLTTYKNLTVGQNTTNNTIINQDGISSTINSNNVKLNLNVTSASSIDPTKTIVSDNKITEVTNLNGTLGSEKDTVINSTISAISSLEVSGTKTSKVSIKSYAETSDINITNDGSTESKISISATGNTSSEIDITAANIVLNGKVQIQSGDLYTNKMFTTSSDTTFSDNQFVTAKYVDDYLNSASSGTLSEISNQLLQKANSSDVYTKIQVDSLMSSIPASSISQSDSGKFVTSTQIASWDSKQDALGFTPENLANKGVVNGYASLDKDGKVLMSELPDLNLDTKNVLFFDSYENMVTGVDLEKDNEKLCIVSPIDESKNEFYSWNIYAVYLNKIVNFSALVSDTLKIDWKNLSNLPGNLVYTVDGKINGDLLSNSGVVAGDYERVTVDSTGRVTLGENPKTSAYEGNTNVDYTFGTINNNVNIFAQTGSSTNPFIRYNITNDKWEFSNDGTTVYQFNESNTSDGDVIDYGLITSTATETADYGLVTAAVTESDDYGNV